MNPALRTFNFSQFPTLVLDLEGNILQANRAAAELSGVCCCDLAGRQVSDLGLGAPWPKAAELIERVRLAGSPVSGEAPERTGRRKWALSAQMRAFAEREQPVIIVEIREATAAKDLPVPPGQGMAAMCSRAASVAHDARNLIFGISSTLDAMEARLGPQSGYHQHLRVLRSELNCLASLMTGLLEDEKAPEPDLAPACVEQVVAQTVNAFIQRSRSADVTIVVRGPGAFPPVLMNRENLGSVLRNLLENAIQHSPAQGVVVLDLETQREGEITWVECTVRDSGPGFHPDALVSGFEPFFTLRRGGTGLGLSIAKRIVEDHGGTICICNRPEGGAHVTVRLPASGPSSDMEGRDG